jgi:hypothetical protein
MRGFLAACLLLLQLQPIAGVVLCQGLALANPDRMEEDCPMDAGNGEAATHQETRGDGSTFSRPDTPHDCMFGEACIASANALIAEPASLRPVFQSTDLLFRLAVAMTGSETRAPPVPPPNS